MAELAPGQQFTHLSHSGRVVFGEGTLSAARAEIERLGGTRALLLATPRQRPAIERLALMLGPLAGGIFAEAAMHTPLGVTERALVAYAEVGADCLLAYGGGSTIGLSKAVAYRNDAPQLVIATTYAGSEVTPILGQTINGVKTTVTASSILPETVIYDPALTLSLPVAMSVASGLNAIAHAVEGLYARDRSPITSMVATEGIKVLVLALRGIVANPRDLASRTSALYGAWLCGTVLASEGMALHHKLCHALGGGFDLPHADLHAVLLPHSVAYTEPTVPELLAPVAEILKAPSAAEGLFRLAQSLGAPRTLRDLGLRAEDLGSAARIATGNPYWNPRPVEEVEILALLERAWTGAFPQ